MVASVPVLIYAGAQLFVLIKKAIMMVTTISQRKKQKSVNQILIAGILLDLLCSYMIIQTNHPDKSLVVFSIAFFGSRILLANLMAISFYFDVEKNKEKGLAKT